MKQVLISPDGDKLITTDDTKNKWDSPIIIEYTINEVYKDLTKKEFKKKMEEYEEECYKEYFRSEK